MAYFSPFLQKQRYTILCPVNETYWQGETDAWRTTEKMDL